MNLRRRLRDLRDDQGFTIPELIVVCLLAGLVLAAVGGMYVSTVVAQMTVGAVSGASNGGQLAARSIDNGIRNATEFQLTANGTTGQLLIVRTAGAADALDWKCQAWYYDSTGDGSIRTTTVADGTVIAMPTAAELSTWTELVEGVAPVTGTDIFTPDAVADTVVQTNFLTVADGRDSTTISFSTPLMPGAQEEDTCF